MSFMACYKLGYCGEWTLGTVEENDRDPSKGKRDRGGTVVYMKIALLRVMGMLSLTVGCNDSRKHFVVEEGLMRKKCDNCCRSGFITIPSRRAYAAANICPHPCRVIRRLRRCWKSVSYCKEQWQVHDYDLGEGHEQTLSGVG